ncbi:hypothetical protein Xcel_2733 [Xylanimonas cellulosilytica DSM 15894]|uniref:Uncharacterized protein n=1 Tax=Xylanimonas cellulosilytica (strain DSM 15894 / JCM 12276 / CECT 5975 / KCTC 9989 / LMG 20990 / NBRC 107835 / XIL07) TaxID=446471 RepID=D1BXV6_XYLCX|nr:hypothetical protein [Xylanimonas cellulosilytica]ACZ31747.1 hypothetical protein Xcel_2733 [Xylanimonas cellulosilytica DSM 15894]
MNPRVLSFVVAAVAYGITLTIAAILLDRMHVPFWTAIIAWALFTLSITLIRPALTKALSKRVHSATWVIGLLTVFLSLLVTTVLTPMRISGFGTWVLATVIVWLGTIVYDMVDDRLVAAARPHADRLQSEIDERFDRDRDDDATPGAIPGTGVPGVPGAPGIPPIDPTGLEPGSAGRP